MSNECPFTGKKPRRGGRIVHRGQTKKSGGIGLQLVKTLKRTFRPNLQKVRVMLPSGQIKRIKVCVKAIKAGFIMKAPRRINRFDVAA